jgi:hypothetical protein
VPNENCESNSRRCGDCVKFGVKARTYSCWCEWAESNPETRGRGCFIGNGLFRGVCQPRVRLHSCNQETGRRDA